MPFQASHMYFEGGGEGMVWGAMLLWLQNLMIKGSKNQLLTREHKPFFSQRNPLGSSSMAWLGAAFIISQFFESLKPLILIPFRQWLWSLLFQ